MEATGGSRIGWQQIPGHVRAALEGAIGAPVERARNEAGGFSPGLAARCRLADGRRVFIKAVSPEQNRTACRIHRREIEVASRLPPYVPAPRLLHVHDDGTWVALVFDEVRGRQPGEPWSMDDLDVVVPAIEDLARRTTPTPVPELQTVLDRHRTNFRGWRRLASGDGDTAALDGWVRDNLATLAELEAGWEVPATGATLLHADLRADNVLIHDGEVTFVDWPWACTGAALVDMVLFLPSVGLGGGPDPATVVERHGLFADVAPEAVAAVLAGYAGFMRRSAQDPDPPGLPRLRAFQGAQADVAVRWLRQLLGS